MNEYLTEGIDTLHRIFGKGVALTPCKGKKAFRRGWNKLMNADMTPQYLNAFPGPNIGVVCGKNSDGLCVLDIDGDDYLAAFFAAVPEAHRWSRVRGRHGAKFFVRVQGSYPRTHFLVKDGAEWGEWRSNGANCVAWGNHPDTGLPYVWENPNPPPEIRFEVIAHALVRVGVCKKVNGQGAKLKPKATTHNDNSSSASVSASAPCALQPVSCALHNTASVGDVVARIKARNQMRSSVAEHFGRLQDLYSRFIEPRFQAAAQHRNGFIVEAIPFLLRCVYPEVAVHLAMMFYDANKALFKDTRERHEYEVRVMVQDVEKTYFEQLSDVEKEVFTILSPQERSAFRLCRDLALLASTPTEPMTFFLSCAELAARLDIWDAQAHRLLVGFVSVGILLPLQKGERWKPGVRPKASTFRWLLPSRSDEDFARSR